MKIDLENKNYAEYIGEIQENRVGIDRNNIDFITTLLTSNLYSKPFESFLRETISNAQDSHIEAGTKEHIILMIEDIPNKSLTYRISIRDYGTGLSPERFNLIYRNIGSSTKRESNEFIGMFGIGRLSCLSCVDVANITSYYNNVKYSYLMYKNGLGINIDKINEEQGEYKNGLEVSIEKSVGTEGCKEAIKHLALFENLYVHYKGDNYALSSFVRDFNNRIVRHYDTFSTCDLFYSSIRNFFKMGNVIYEDTSKKALATKGLIIDLPIGSVDIVPSREALQFTEKTTATIDEKIEEVKAELQKLANGKYKNNYTLKEFYNYFIVEYPIKVGELDIALFDVNLKLVDITINNCTIPNKFLSFLKIYNYKGIVKELVYKTLRGKVYGYSLRNVIKGESIWAVKKDPKLKHITWQYYSDKLRNELYTKKNVIILEYNGVETLKNLLIKDIKSDFRSSFNENEIRSCIDFIFKFITIQEISNDGVPEDFIKKYKQEHKRVKTIKNANDIPIRLYDEAPYEKKYKKGYLSDILNYHRGFVLYNAHTNEDEDISTLATMFYHYPLKVITIKAEYISLICNNRKFQSINRILFMKNRLLVKWATAYIIRENFYSSNLHSEVRSLPIWREFCSTYQRELIAINNCVLTNRVKEIVDYYKNRGWVNKIDIERFSLTKEDIKACNFKSRLYNDIDKIVNRIAFKKFGKLPNIGLKYVPDYDQLYV